MSSRQANALDRIHIDTCSMRPFQGSVAAFDGEDALYIPQDPAVQAAQQSQRILDFLAGQQAYSYRRRESVPEAQARMAQKLQDFDRTFERASRSATA